MNNRLFLSHSGIDKEAAMYLKGIIEENYGRAVTVFCSSDKKAQVSLNWLSEIDRAFDESIGTIVLMTHNTLTNTWVHFEAGVGYQKSKRIFIAPVGITHLDYEGPLRIIEFANDLKTKEGWEELFHYIDNLTGYDHTKKEHTVYAGYIRSLDINSLSQFMQFKEVKSVVANGLSEHEIKFTCSPEKFEYVLHELIPELVKNQVLEKEISQAIALVIPGNYSQFTVKVTNSGKKELLKYKSN